MKRVCHIFDAFATVGRSLPQTLNITSEESKVGRVGSEADYRRCVTAAASNDTIGVCCDPRWHPSGSSANSLADSSATYCFDEL